MQAASWLRREAQQIRKPQWRAALATALQALALVVQAWLLADILDAALFAHAPLVQLWPQWIGLLLLAPLRLLLNFYARRTSFSAALDLTARLRTRLLARAQALGPIGLRAQTSGDLITRLVDGVDAVLPYFARYLPQVSTAALVPLLLALFVFPADWISGLILLLTAPLIPFFMVLVGSAAERASQQRYAQLTRLGAAFMDALGGLATLRQLGAAERVAQRLDADGEDYRKLTMQVLRVAFLSALVLEFFATVSIAVVAVLIGFRLLWGELPFRDGLFVLLLAPEFYLPLRALGSLRHARMDALAAAQHLAALEDTPPPASAPLTGGALAPARAAPGLRVDAVHYSHAGRAAALRGCSFDIQPRGVTALIGATGSGKSTLLNLLLGFMPAASGRILVEGVDLSELDMTQWRARVAWVPQQTHVFEGSVRDNLLLAAPGADSLALQRAAADSGFDAVLARLPQGWDTPLGERGLGLSGGELQRLALTRALLREDACVWLLDEPTAHLDAESAHAVDQVIRAAAATRTVLVVAHRLVAAQSADWLVVLRDGAVIEQGTPQQLAHAQGAYAALLQAEAQ